MYFRNSDGAPPKGNAPITQSSSSDANRSIERVCAQAKAPWPSWAIPRREFERHGKFIVWPRAGAHREPASDKDRARDREDLIKSLQRHEELKPAIEAFTLLWEQQDRGVVFDAWAMATPRKGDMATQSMLDGFELTVLNGLLNGADLSVTAEDLTPPNDIIFAKIKRLPKKHLGAWTALIAALQLSGQLAKVGGRARIVDLSNLPLDEANVQFALDEVLQASRKRREREIGKKLAQDEISADEAQIELAATAPPLQTLLPAPAPYTPPPLDLLPAILQEYIIAGAESLNVDVGYVALPLDSALSSAIGNSRSILLKRGFTQPPIDWTGVIGRSGSLKTPSIEIGCRFIGEHERGLQQLNQTAKEIYDEELARWKEKKKKGAEPEPPKIATCMMDDLTLEVVALRLEDNPRGILLWKDELSHFFESLDLYHGTKRTDLSRWCSLHTGVQFLLDRRTDNRHHRIWLPRACITGGVQPAILHRLLSDEYFQRGLAARFNFVYPPPRQDRWSDAVIDDDIVCEARKLFNQLWELRPGQDEHGQPCPVMLRLSPEAKEIYTAFYNESGETAFESDDREAAAWSKLTGYAARFALKAQLCHNPRAETVTGEIMLAACERARWQGQETTRIYSFLIETTEQREDRRLAEWIQHRGGAATVRDAMRGPHMLQGKPSDEVEQLFNRLVKTGLGKWDEVKPTGRGRPTRILRLFPPSKMTQLSNSREETENSVSVSASSNPF